METNQGVRPKLAIVVTFVGVACFGWVVRYTLAQGGDRTRPKVDAPADLPLVKPEPLGDLDAAAKGSTVEDEDPEKAAKAFVDQNRRVAEDRLKSLKDEAEKLRSRLRKVEAGIRRWETLVSALNREEDAPTARAASEAEALADRDSRRLEPVPRARAKVNANAVSDPGSPDELQPIAAPKAAEPEPPPAPR
jgi:hypothetical protein